MRGGISYIGLCNAIPKHWRKVFRRDNENDVVVSDESVHPFKNSPPTCRQARAFYLSKSFQKPTSEVRLVEANFFIFTAQTIAALYVLPFELTKNEKLSMFQFKINHHILKKKATNFSRPKLVTVNPVMCVNWPLQKIPEHTIMLFVCHPKILHKRCFQFLLGVKMAPRETENNAYAEFWVDKQRALWYVIVFSGVVNWSRP